MPIVALIVLVVGAVGLAMWLRQASAAEAAAETVDEHVPFSKYRDEAPPTREPKGEARPWREAPEGLEAEEAWVNALAIAKDADELLDQANRAREAGDNAGYQDKGRAAKETYDRALELTAEWEERIVAEYGEGNPTVRAIVRTRSRWFDRLRVLHKTTGR